LAIPLVLLFTACDSEGVLSDSSLSNVQADITVTGNDVGSDETTATDTGNNDATIPITKEPAVKLKIVSTIFPQYDWVREILGDEAEYHELILLMDNRVDLHSFQPSAADIVNIASADLFIHVGGVSDEWVEDVLRQADNQEMIIINLLDTLGDAARMEANLEVASDIANTSACSHGHQEEDCDEEHGLDEHVWLSLRNAAIFTTAITDALIALNPESGSEYLANREIYTEKLTELDLLYQEVVAEAAIKTVLFADRFPFLYLMEDYGIDFYAAFSGCSAEAEASFSTIVFLAQKVDELGLHSIMITESADQSIARTVISSTETENQAILVLNALQSVTRREIEAGAAYLAIMEANLAVLSAALGEK
jgi:zinc transport system substrate-binding protein